VVAEHAADAPADAAGDCRCGNPRSSLSLCSPPGNLTCRPKAAAIRLHADFSRVEREFVEYAALKSGKAGNKKVGERSLSELEEAKDRQCPWKSIRLRPTICQSSLRPPATLTF